MDAWLGPKSPSYVLTHPAEVGAKAGTLHSAMVSSGVAPCSGVAGGAGLGFSLRFAMVSSGVDLCSGVAGGSGEAPDVDSLGSLSGKWAASGVARAASISSTCQPMFLAAVSLDKQMVSYLTSQLWSGFPD